MKFRVIRWWILGLAVLVAGAWWLWPKPPAAPETVAIKYGDLSQTVAADGVVNPQRKVDVGARLTAQITGMHVKLGDHVRRGQLLVSLDASQSRTEVATAEAALASAQVDLQARRNTLADAREELQRQDAMIQRQATTGQEQRKARSAERGAEDQLNAAGTVVKQRRAELARARLVDAQSQIRAPIDGDVVAIPVQEGQTVNSAQTAPTLLTIAVLDTVTIKAKISESDVDSIHAGQHVVFSTVGNPGRERQGTVRLLQALPEKVGETPMYDALIDVDNSDRSLLPEMHVNARFDVASARHVLVLPASALGKSVGPNLFEVKVAPNAKALPAQLETRQVKVGIHDGANVQVLSGLKEAELAVVPIAAKG